MSNRSTFVRNSRPTAEKKAPKGASRSVASILAKPWSHPGTALLAAMLLFGGQQAAWADALSWLKGKSPKRETSSSDKTEKPRASAMENRVPSFFADETQGPDVTGKSMDLVKFVGSHWSHAAKNLEATTRGIDGKIQVKRCSDITRKLYTIVSQDARESLKLSATGLSGLDQGNQGIDSLLNEISRIVTAPNQETLANLETAVNRTRAANEGQARLARSYLAAAEGMIGLANETYGTLELIPSLSITPLDLYIQGGKTLMRQLQSNNEAVKGLLLNVQSGCDQVAAGLDLMISAVKNTLRFSDHFAFQQYPLVNLPVPTREKLFSQISTVKNTLKGVANTIEIGNSQVRNSAQQFNNLVDNLTTKIRDALQYQTAVDMAAGNLPQISTYAQNQINGLYQRTKEAISETRLAMAKQARTDSNSAPPQIALESRDESQTRNAQRAAGDRLPLFLLGGKATPGTSGKTQPRDESSVAATGPGLQLGAFAKAGGSGQTTILYSEKPEPSSSFGLRADEADILQKELGTSIPYVEMAKSPAPTVMSDPAPSASLGGGFEGDVETGRGDGISEFLNSTDPMPSQPVGRLAPKASDQTAAVSSHMPSSDANGDMEIMRFENGSGLSETSDLLPLFRLDGDKEPKQE